MLRFECVKSKSKDRWLTFHDGGRYRIETQLEDWVFVPSTGHENYLDSSLFGVNFNFM